MKVNLKSKSGITLVALIITIIVLLILAIVSIRLVMNGGIIDKSKNAVDKYSNEEIMEQIKLAYQEYQMSQYTDNPLTLQQAMDKAFGEGVATVSGDATNGWTVTVKGIAYPLSANGTVGEGVAVVSWTKTDDETYTNGTQTLKVGDYVNYDPTAGATEEQMTYTSKAEKSGWDNDQSFDARTYKNAGYRWRVLDVKDGQVRLISEEYVGPGTYNDQNRTQYYLKGQAGYINGVEELNTISSIFGYGTGAESATSITVDDINAITGFNPENPRYNQGQWEEYGNTITYTYNNENNYTARRTNGVNGSSNTDTIRYPFYYFENSTRTFKKLESGSVDIISTEYSYNIGSYAKEASIGKDSDQNNILNKTYEELVGYKVVGDDNLLRIFSGKTDLRYWLASSYVMPYSVNVFYGNFCIQAGKVSSPGAFSADDAESESYYGVRPIVTLSSSTNLQWNATSNQWEIQ